MENLEIAKLAMDGMKDEADTVIKYTEMLKSFTELGASEEVIAQLKEIISDELNHIQNFGAIYTVYSGINPSED